MSWWSRINNGRIMRSSLWIFIILYQRSTVTCKSSGTINVLSDSDLVGHSVTIVCACIAHYYVWITTCLSLTDLKRICWRINRNQTIEWCDQCIGAVWLLNSTSCNRAHWPWHSTWSYSLGITKSFQISPNNSCSCWSIIGIVFCCQGLSC
jgi:hypothetical protein